MSVYHDLSLFPLNKGVGVGGWQQDAPFAVQCAKVKLVHSSSRLNNLSKNFVKPYSDYSIFK